MKVLLLLVFVFAFAQSLEIDKVSYALPGTYRALTVVGSPSIGSPNGIAVKGVALDVSKTNISAGLDAAAFAFVNPALPLQSNVGFYFGYLKANFSYSPVPQVAKIEGALAEVGSAFSDIFVWYNKDGQDGFQVALGNLFWDCTNSKTTDCMDTSLTLSLSSLSWSTISMQNLSCPAGYASNCRVFAFTTTGSYLGSATISFTLKIASQPVFIDNVEVKPDFAKIDVTVTYPWTTKGATAGSDARVGLVMVAAGKSASWSGQVARVGARDGLVWSGSGASAYFAWDGTATIAGQQSTVFAVGVTGDALLNYNCTQSNNPILCTIFNTVMIPYRTLALAWKVFGWQVQFVFFSWNDVKPVSVEWDPTMGTSAAGISSASFAFCIGSLLFLLWNNKN